MADTTEQEGAEDHSGAVDNYLREYVYVYGDYECSDFVLEGVDGEESLRGRSLSGAGKGKGKPPGLAPPAKGKGAPAPPQKGKGAAPPPPPAKGKGNGKAPLGPPPPAGKGAKGQAQPAPFGKRLHWSHLPDERLQETVFAELDAAEKPQIDLKVLELMLQQDKESGKAKSKPSAKAPRSTLRGDNADTKSDKVVFLDQKRSQNIAIALRKVCDKGGTKELADSLRVLDLDNPIAPDNCEVLIDTIPQVYGTGLEQYQGAEERLQKNELELLNLIRVPRLIPRLSMMLFVSQMEETYNLAAADVATLAKASAQVKNSSHLRSVLKTALSVGNYVNTGEVNASTEVRGITIDSVLKMHQYKLKDGLSALHFVTQQLTEKEPQFAHKMRAEIKDVEAMTPGSLQALRDRIGDLEKREHEVCNELEYKDAYEVDGDRRAVDALTRLAERTKETVRAVRRQYNNAIDDARACAAFYAAGGLNNPEEAVPDTTIEEFFKTVQDIASKIQVCSSDLDAQNRAVRGAGRSAASALGNAQRRDSQADTPPSDAARPRAGSRMIIREETDAQAANNKVAGLLRARAAACDAERECS